MSSTDLVSDYQSIHLFFAPIGQFQHHVGGCYVYCVSDHSSINQSYAAKVSMNEIRPYI